MNGDAHSSRGDSGRGGSSREHHSSRRDEHRERDRGDRGERGGDRAERGGERRRRSRSPGHRSSRREYEVDSYSSSRDYAAREREDRYRDRRDERGWDRDRGYERRERRDDARPDRRERGDLFEERRGGGGGGRGERGDRRDRGDGGRSDRGDRDAFAQQRGARDDKKRSPSPPKKKKEPTPDLTEVASVLDRKRRLTQWDIKPPGYENVTAEQAKLSGMFPLPGAPRQQPMDPSRLQAFMNQPAGSAGNNALKPSQARQSKRLFVSNIPASATDATINDFFNLQLNGLNAVSGVDPCISSGLSPDRSFAILEFKSPEDATVALAMDGISMEPDDTEDANSTANGSAKGFQIRRPKDYIAPTPSEDTDEAMGSVSSVVKDSPNKISVTSIPPYLSDEQVTELLTSFGDLKAFLLVKDTGTEQSKGIAFCEYADSSATEGAIEALNGMELGDMNLRVQRASVGATQAGAIGEMGVSAMTLLAGTSSSDLEQGRVIQLLNMVVAEELMDNQEYEEILEDVKEECSKYGAVLEMKIPRPSGGSRQSAGVGKIFVKYDGPASAAKALKALAGRKFADRTVLVTYFGEDYFDVNAW